MCFQYDEWGTCVNALVSLQSSRVAEGSLTVNTDVWFLPTVNTHMSLQISYKTHYERVRPNALTCIEKGWVTSCIKFKWVCFSVRFDPQNYIPLYSKEAQTTKRSVSWAVRGPNWSVTISQLHRVSQGPGQEGTELGFMVRRDSIKSLCKDQQGWF